MESICLWNRWTHALFWLFPICSAIFSCQHGIYMRTIDIRYRWCICSCGFDMGERVCILVISDIVDRYDCHMIHMSVQNISSKCLRYMESIWQIDERMHCSDCFQYALQYVSCQHVIYMRTVLIIRYRLCICSACWFDMGKRVCILATYFNIVDRYDCHMESIWAFRIYHPNVFAIWNPYGSEIDERMHCSDCFQYALQYFLVNTGSICGLYW